MKEEEVTDKGEKEGRKRNWEREERKEESKDVVKMEESKKAEK